MTFCYAGADFKGYKECVVTRDNSLPSQRVFLFRKSQSHAITTRAPSRPKTPGSCGLGLEALPFLLERKPSIPEGFGLEGGTADLSANSDHAPDSSNTTCTPPLLDAFLRPRFGGLSFDDGTREAGGIASSSSGGEPEVGELNIDLWFPSSELPCVPCEPWEFIRPGAPAG